MSACGLNVWQKGDDWHWSAYSPVGTSYGFEKTQAAANSAAEQARDSLIAEWRRNQELGIPPTR